MSLRLLGASVEPLVDVGCVPLCSFQKLGYRLCGLTPLPDTGRTGQHTGQRPKDRSLPKSPCDAAFQPSYAVFGPTRKIVSPNILFKKRPRAL